MKKNKTIKFLMHVFIAGKHNTYRPHATRYYGLAIFLFVIFSFSMALNFQKTSALGAKTNLDTASIAIEINRARMRNGLGDLKIDQSLKLAAEKKAEDIFKNQYWAHKSPSGKTPWAFMDENGYKYTLGGENLAKGYNTAEDTVNAWLVSIKHRENILSKDFRDIGIAVKNGRLLGRDTQVVVTIYGTKRGEEVAGASDGNIVSKYASLLMDSIGFYSNPISPVLLLILAFIGLYATVAAATHIKIRRSKGIKHKSKMQRVNSYKLGIVIISAILFNIYFAIFYT